MKKMILTMAFTVTAMMVTGFSFAEATPSRIIVMRHAEKPDDPSATGLTSAGFARAQALVGFFSSNSVIAEKGEPQFIFAKYDATSSSPALRAVETATPLATALGLTMNKGYGTDNRQAMADLILNNATYDGKVVVIFWDHKEIPDLAQELGMTDAPSKWKKTVYDRFWVADYASNGSVTAFRDLPENLMPGDTDDSVFFDLR